MIAQAVLSLLLCSVLVYAWIEYRRSPVVALLSYGAALAGIYFVWVPSHSTWVAEFVGVGRGVDLILYMWVCISLIIFLNLHLKLRAQHELITALARSIALANVSSQTAGAPRDAGTPSGPAVSERAVQNPQPDAVGAHKSKQKFDRTA
jgi:hypothetical protein